MFANWIFLQNAKVVLWLNKSYIMKGSTPVFVWCIIPSVFLRILSRLFFITIKFVMSFISKFFSPSKKTGEKVYNNSQNQVTDNLENKLRRSFIDILLFRNIFPETFEEHTKVEEPVLSELIKNHITFEDHANPVVSIIIPVYNKVEYTYNCLLSLYKNLTANYTFEIIIIDDGSSDQTTQIVRNKGYCLC